MKSTKILSFFLAVLTMIGTLTMGMTVNAADVTYSDVTKDMWSYGDIVYVTESGLMNGTGGSTFSPTVALTRAMVVTVLYRMEGSPEVSFKDKEFMDVKAEQFYSEAVKWAFDQQIVTGTGTDEWGVPYFSPDRSITRQELATMFVRFAAYKYVNTNVNTTLDKFSDKADVASWAETAMKWATSVGLINGTGNGSTLSPLGSATREQFAAIIHRFNTLEFDYNHYYAEPVPATSFTAPVYEKVTDADIYVAVDGNDNNPGTLDKPLATFEGAKAKVRELKKTAKDEIVVAFKAGNYGELNNITFTAEDSGTEAVPVTYRVYGDGDVIFQNGYSMPEDSFKPIDDSDKPLFKEEAFDLIKKHDLSGVVDPDFNIKALFYEGGICHEARFPNKYPDGADRAYTNMTTTVDKYCSIMLQGPVPSVVESFRTTEGMKVTGFLRVGWLIETFEVKSYDPETNILTFNTYEGFMPDSGYPIGESAGGFDFMFEGRTEDSVYFHNLADQLDAKGEYWYNPKTQILYVYNPKGTYTVATGGEFMSFSNADYISFTGLTFDASNAFIAFPIGYADYLTFDGCTFSNFSGDRVINFDRCLDLKFTRNEMFNFGATGMYVTPFWKDRIDDFDNSYYALKESGIVIDNNYFHDFGFVDMWSGAINFYCNSGSRISHNYFKNGAHAAVEFNASHNIMIEYNVFDNMMMSTADYGAVYTNWGIENRGNVIRYNLFKNIRTAGAQYAIYLDGDSAGVEIYGNLFHDGGTCGVTINGGRDNMIHDNVFIIANGGRRFLFSNLNPDTAAYLEGDRSYVPGTGNDIKSVMYGIPREGEPGYDLWKETYPYLYTYHDDFSKLGDPECIFTTINYVENNYQIGDKPIEEKAYLLYGVGHETNKVISIDENPFFKNPAKGDYSIVGNAIDIPFEMMGQY